MRKRWGWSDSSNLLSLSGIENKISRIIDDKAESVKNITTNLIKKVSLLSQTANKHFSGDPLGLYSFINTIELLESDTNVVYYFQVRW